MQARLALHYSENMRLVSESTMRNPYHPDSTTPTDTENLPAHMVYSRRADSPLLKDSHCAAIRSPRALKSRPQCSSGELSLCGGQAGHSGMPHLAPGVWLSGSRWASSAYAAARATRVNFAGEAQPSSEVKQEGQDMSMGSSVSDSRVPAESGSAARYGGF